MQLSDSESCFFPCLFSEQHMSEQAWWCSTIVCLSTTVNSCKSRWSFEIWMSGYYKQHMSAICTLCLIVDLAGLIWNLVLSWVILSARWYWSTDPKPKALHCFVWFWLEGFWWECRWITDNRYNTIGDGYLLCDRKSPHIYIYIYIYTLLNLKCFVPINICSWWKPNKYKTKLHNCNHQQHKLQLLWIAIVVLSICNCGLGII